jgi:WD40 repeat protein
MTFAGTVHLWDVLTGRERRWQVFQQGGHCLLFTPDGKSLLCTDREGGVFRLDLLTGRRRRLPLELPWHQTWLLLTPGGDTLITWSRSEKQILLWDLASGKQLHRLKVDEPVAHAALAFAPSPPGSRSAPPAVAPAPVRQGRENSCWLVVALLSEIRIWDTRTGLERTEARKPLTYRPRQGGSDLGNSVLACSPDGQTVACDDGEASRIRFWPVTSRTERLRGVGHRDAIYGVAVQPGARTVSTVSADGTCCLWERCTGRLLAAHRHPDFEQNHLEFCQTTGQIVTALRDGTVTFREPGQGRVIRRFNVGKLAGIALSGNGQRLLVRDAAGPRLKLFDTTSGRLLKDLEVKGWSNGQHLSFDGSLAAFDDTNSRLMLWQVSPGRAVQPDDDTNSACVGLACAFSPDGQTFASAHRWLSIRSTRKGNLLHALIDFDTSSARSLVSSLAYSPDSRMLALGHLDGSLTFWEVISGQQRFRITGHRGGVFALTFSADGRYLVSAGADTAALVWDLRVAKRSHLPSGGLKERGQDAWLQDLRSENARQAFQALFRLAEGRDVPAVVLSRLLPEICGDRHRVLEWVTALDAREFARREQASRELQALGGQAEELLQQTLKKPTSAEQRVRVQRLLERLRQHPITPQRILGVRTLELLERVGTAEARRVVQTIAREAADLWIRQQADLVLKRWKERGP